MTTELYRIEKHKYGWLIYGSAIPVDDFNEICKLAGNSGVMSPGIASAMLAHTALCANESNEQAWREEIEASLSDFGRCYRLLQKFPDWIPRLPEVAAAYPATAWPMIVKSWADLTKRYEAKDHEGIYEILFSIHDKHYAANKK